MRNIDVSPIMMSLKNIFAKFIKKPCAFLLSTFFSVNLLVYIAETLKL